MGQLPARSLLPLGQSCQGLLLQFRLFSHTVPSGVGQHFGGCSEVLVLCVFYQSVIKGLPATTVLSPKAEPGWCFSHGGKLNFVTAAYKLQKACADLASAEQAQQGWRPCSKSQAAQGLPQGCAEPCSSLPAQLHSPWNRACLAL